MKQACALVLLTVLLAVSAALAQDVAIFQGRGEASLEKNSLVTARLLARKQALEQAVLQAVRQAVPSTQYEQKKDEIREKILGRADKYVQSYEIIQSEAVQDVYVMNLEARVDLKRLIQDIDKLRPEKESGGAKARILLVTTTRWQDAEDPWPLLFEPLANRLEMVDLAPLSEKIAEEYLASDAFVRYQERRWEPTYDFGAQAGARYALVIRTVIKTQAGAGCPATGVVRFLDLASRQVLADFPYDFSQEAGCREVAAVGARTIFSLLTEKLRGRSILESAPAVALRLEVTGLRAYRDTTELVALLRSLPDIKSIAMESFATGGRVTFRITYEGSTEDLVAAIKNLAPVGFKLTPRVAPDDRLLFEAEY